MRSLAVALVLIGIFGLSVSSFARDVSIGKHTRRGGQKRLRQSRREIFTRRNGILLWKQLSWWPWHRSHRWLQNRPDMHRPRDWQWTPHYSCKRAGSSTGKPSLSYYMSVDIRFTPESRHVQRTSRCPLCANSGHVACFGANFRQLPCRFAIAAR